MAPGAGARALLREFVRAGRGFGDYNLRECAAPPPPLPLSPTPFLPSPPAPPRALVAGRGRALPLERPRWGAGQSGLAPAGWGRGRGGQGAAWLAGESAGRAPGR